MIPVGSTGIPEDSDDGDWSEKSSDSRANGQVRRTSSWDDVGLQVLMSEAKGSSSSSIF